MAHRPENDPAGSEGQPQSTGMLPGDEAPPGTPGTGEGICPTCDGSGKVDGQPCPDCNGSGKVTEGIGGA